MKCPIHKEQKLVPQKTRFGRRYACPVEGCTVAAWSGSTSTPADYPTRQIRIQAHIALDSLWRSGTFKRQEIYKRLAEHLGLPVAKTHIGHFDKAQCQCVIAFSNDFYPFLCSKKL